MGGKTMILCGTLLAALTATTLADGSGRIYTQPTDTDSGVISGKVKGAVLTHAIAVERDRTRIYQAILEAQGSGFRFAQLPVGRFDLVLVTRDHQLYEGISLGVAVTLPAERAQHLATAVAKSDSFFNRHISHRTGVEGEVALVFAERIRDEQILRGSGEGLNANLRRLEIIELRAAADDWQLVRTRHLYREEAPRLKGLPFLIHRQLPALGGVRVATTPRDLGTLDLTPH